MALRQCFYENGIGHLDNNAILAERARLVKCFLLGLGPEAVKEAFDVRG